MKILAALDFSDVMDNVVTTARKLAGASSATVILLHVLPEENQGIEFHPTIEPRYHPPKNTTANLTLPKRERTSPYCTTKTSNICRALPTF